MTATLSPETIAALAANPPPKPPRHISVAGMVSALESALDALAGPGAAQAAVGDARGAVEKSARLARAIDAVKGQKTAAIAKPAAPTPARPTTPNLATLPLAALRQLVAELFGSASVPAAELGEEVQRLRLDSQIRFAGLTVPGVSPGKYIVLRTGVDRATQAALQTKVNEFLKGQH